MVPPSHKLTFLRMGGEAQKTEKILKSWAKAKPSPFDQKIHPVHELESHQAALENKIVDAKDIQTETALQVKLHNACKIESDWWKLKARNDWLIEGDRNSSYFHKQAAARNNFNYVQEIHTQDCIISNHEEIKEEATRHFSALFSDQLVLDDADLMRLIPNDITINENESLMQAITMEEIKRTVDSMKDDRAPGPDGFNATFVKLC